MSPELMSPPQTERHDEDVMPYDRQSPEEVVMLDLEKRGKLDAELKRLKGEHAVNASRLQEAHEALDPANSQQRDLLPRATAEKFLRDIPSLLESFDRQIAAAQKVIDTRAGTQNGHEPEESEEISAAA